MNDLISRQAAIDALHMHLMYRMGTDSNKKRLDEWINNLPSAQPYTAEEIDKMQELEVVQIEKAYELGRESAQPEQRWIPCSERLPEVPCLVSDANNNFPYVPEGIITLEDKEHGKWAIDGKWFERMMLDSKEADMLIYSNRIVAWMPLPEPYRGGDTT